MKRVAGLIGVGLVALIAWYAQAQPGMRQAAETDTPRRITIAWIPKSLNNPIFELGRKGALQKAAELSRRGPFQVDVLAVASVAADAAEQARVVEDVIARGVDGIALSCNDPTACIAPINAAVRAGIPVMTWDADAPQSQRFAYLGIDNYRAGQAAAELLIEAMGPHGTVAILSGVPGALNLEERIRGFKARIAEYPQIHIVTTVNSNDDITLGIQAVEETMQAYPALDGWFFAGMWPLFSERGSMPLWERAATQGHLQTVAFDTLPFELELLRDGYLTGLIGQKYWAWGYDTTQILYDKIVTGRSVPPFIDSGMDIVTAKNVDAMLRAWQTNDFSQPLAAP